MDVIEGLGVYTAVAVDTVVAVDNCCTYCSRHQDLVLLRTCVHAFESLHVTTA
jgi:hypothetical protein